MGLFRSTHHTTSPYDEEEPLQGHHEVLELEPTSSTLRRTSFSSDTSSIFDDNTLNHDNESKQRQRQKRRRRYQQQRLRRQQQQQQPGYQRLGGQLVDAWHSVTTAAAAAAAAHLHHDHDVGHLTEDDTEPAQYPEDNIDNRFKRSLYLLLEEPSSSRAAFCTNVVVSFLIVSSAVMTTIETIPTFRSAESNRVWFHLESTMVALFTLEYILRLFAHSDSLQMLKRFVIAPISIIDFISIVPFYIEVIAQRDTTYEFRFTILRLFRLLRLFKTYKYSNAIIMTIEVMMVALRRSGDALSALFFFLVTCVVLFSTLLYFAERGTWDETLKTFVDPEGNPSAFDSIPAAFWFVLVTITTTGYGDMVPTTFIGKLVTFPAMMFGVLLIALPSIIVGRNFTIVWESMRRRQYLEQLQAPQPVDGSTDPDTATTPMHPPLSAYHHSTTRRPSMAIDDPLGTTLTSLRPRSGSMNTNNGTDQPFNILDTGDEALFNQLHSLITITRQNQEDIQRILTLLESRSATTALSSTMTANDVTGHSQQLNGLDNASNQPTVAPTRTSLDRIAEE
ncbi:uncharacterized protein BX664DRAFT_319452 [Halteromyces radiatus]|uniref:uncharacterized protein n=1 Tax=Halteromyces radiatus TaxID=101107 RepID=UPI002220E40A|nr:uncharacterized protein BX664DRAFT_319452 [Halteromyces radiatus]KAI8098735.1 hypothetical protein BX664DRAFT_319452 [Halteromyces radiatus]